MKTRRSITIEPIIALLIEERAMYESRNFSNMVEKALKEYLKKVTTDKYGISGDEDEAPNGQSIN